MRFLTIALLITLLTSCASQEKKFEPVEFADPNSPERLEKIDDKTLANWSGKLDINNLQYFKYKQLEGPFKPLVINVTGDHYFALRLLTFDVNDHIIGDYEIAGGSCGGPTEREDKIEFCPVRTSKMISPTTFSVKSIQKFYLDWTDSLPIQVDSTQWKIEINDKGQIIEERL